MAGPIISENELAGMIEDPGVRVVDTRWYLLEPERGRAEYEAGHIPGAVYASLDEDLSGTSSGMQGPGRHPLPTPADFAASMATLGIDRRHRVVAYDDRGGAIAARLWWMLTAQGFDRAQVLDGGITAWIRAGLPVTASVPRPVELQPFTAVAWTGTISIEEVAERTDATVLLDARAADRYRGEAEPIDPKAGHIPGARSLPLTDLLTAGERFAATEELRARFAAVGVRAETPTVAHCGSGVTACHLILAAEAAGLPRPALYVGSWSEWSSTTRPVATGPTP